MCYVTRHFPTYPNAFILLQSSLSVLLLFEDRDRDGMGEGSAAAAAANGRSIDGDVSRMKQKTVIVDL